MLPIVFLIFCPYPAKPTTTRYKNGQEPYTKKNHTCPSADTVFHNFAENSIHPAFPNRNNKTRHGYWQSLSIAAILSRVEHMHKTQPIKNGTDRREIFRNRRDGKTIQPLAEQYRPLKFLQRIKAVRCIRTADLATMLRHCINPLLRKKTNIRKRGTVGMQTHLVRYFIEFRRIVLFRSSFPLAHIHRSPQTPSPRP